MRLKTGAITTELTGGIAGHVLQGSPSGLVMRANYIKKRQASYQQNLRRVSMARLYRAWIELSQAKRNEFLSFNHNGLKGQNLFIKLNLPRLYDYLSISDDLDKLLLYPLGPELFPNPFFNDLSVFASINGFSVENGFFELSNDIDAEAVLFFTQPLSVPFRQVQAMPFLSSDRCIRHIILNGSAVTSEFRYSLSRRDSAIVVNNVFSSDAEGDRSRFVYDSSSLFVYCWSFFSLKNIVNPQSI